MNAVRIVLMFGFLFLRLSAFTQLCTGSLGDPIVNITFGAGANPGPSLSAAATGYNYLTTDCPSDGQYAVRSSTANCFGTWHNLTSDHTGNPNGYFMLVNASHQPSAFYIDTVNLGCSNTVYEFAAWAINMLRREACNGSSSILPNLSFSVERTDGTVLKTYNTGDIPVSPVIDWRQYGFFFTAPPGVSKIVLRIYNNAPGGCGNDLALDDITFRPCGPLITTSINGAGNSKNFCQGNAEAVVLTSTISSGYTDPLFQWQKSADSGRTWLDIAGANATTLVQNFTAASPPASHRYRLAVSKKENSAIALCRVNSPVSTVNINPLPATKIRGGAPLCQNSTLTLQTDGNDTYSWQGPDGFIATSNIINIADAQEKHSGKYIVSATSNAGCVSTDSVMITVNPRPTAMAAPADTSVCEGEAVMLTGSGGNTFLWSPAAGLTSSTIPNPVAKPAVSTRYSLIVSNTFSCTDTAFAQITVFFKPVANAGGDVQLLKGQSVVLNGSVKGTDINHIWSPDSAINNIQVLQPEVAPLQNASYVLTATSAAGCGTVSDTVNVVVLKDIYVPTSFTPNGDGKNEVWKPAGLILFADKEVRVFNRYGQVIFFSRNNDPWDGRYKGAEQPTGLYPYIIKIQKLNLLLKGWVMLIR